jgi:hypothetical protein
VETEGTSCPGAAGTVCILVAVAVAVVTESAVAVETTVTAGRVMLTILVTGGSVVGRVALTLLESIPLSIASSLCIPAMQDGQAVGEVIEDAIMDVELAEVETVDEVGMELVVHEASVEQVMLLLFSLIELTFELIFELTLESIFELTFELIFELALESIFELAFELIIELALESIFELALESIFELALESIFELTLELTIEA